MKSDHQKRVEAFMEMNGQYVPESPKVPTPETRLLRARLIYEEAMELIYELGCELKNGLIYVDIVPRDVNVHNVAKECADLSVVTIGTLSAFGIHDESILKLVDENNMTKIGGGQDKFGKALKPKGYKPVDLSEAL